jgi:glycerol kinase
VLRVDGGASANDLLMQMQSDFSAVTVQSSSNPEATAQGAAFLAGLAVGFFADRNEIKSLVGVKKSFLPLINEEERKRSLDGWHRAISACRKFSEIDE